MKFIKNAAIALFVLLAVLAKKGSTAFERIGKATQSIERIVNKATQSAERIGNKAVKNPNIQRGVFVGSRNAARSGARNASQQPQIRTCPRCHGRGNVRGNDGYVYCCGICNGSGRIVIR